MATENLALPLLEGGQAQKHVTMNEALRQIDAAVQLSVTSALLNDPPSGAAEGARYIVGAAPTGLWGGHAGDIAIRRGGGWAFVAPGNGWLAFDRAVSRFLYWSGAIWSVGAGLMSESEETKLGTVAAHAAAQPLPRTIVVLGSSNAAGLGASSYGGDPSAGGGWASPPTSWAGRLATALSGWTVINRSISGTNTAASIARFWTDVAPHRPSHVILANGIHNEGYDARAFMRGMAELCRLCDLIGAVPVIRNASVSNTMSAAEYAAIRSANQQIERLGRPVIDALSTLDDGSGHYVGGGTYHAGDGVHANDAGYAAQFGAIDLGIFSYAARGRVETKRPGVWRIMPSATAENAMVVDAAAGLNQALQSFTMRARIGGVASGGATSRGFLAAYCMGAGAPLRLRNPSITYDLTADTTLLTSSSINPTNNDAVRDCVMVFRHTTGVASLYIDGLPIGSGSVSGASPASRFCFGSRADASTSTAAVGYRFADCQLWSVPLAAETIADMARTGSVQTAGLVFDSIMSGTPHGVIPNAVPNAVMPSLAAVWETAATY
jgi:lysophospholipase L1-like esterase